MSRPHFDDESPDDFGHGKKRKSWKDQRHEKGRKKETKRDFYEHDEEQDNRRDIHSRW